MRRLPLSLGTIHFVGIGGIGMNGLAIIMKGIVFICSRCYFSEQKYI